MKKYFTIIATFIILLVNSGHIIAQNNNTAPEWPSASIAVINTVLLEQNSRIGKELSEQIETIRKSFVKETDEIQAKFRQKRADLIKQRSILSEDSFRQKQTELQQEFQILENDFNTRKKDIDNAIIEGRKKIRELISQIVAQVMKTNNIDLVINNNNNQSFIVGVRANIEITKDVLQIMDSSNASIRLATIPNDEQPESKQ